MTSKPKAPEKPSPTDPVRPDEIGRLFQPLGDFSALALAVSGGADSMALMRLTRSWLDDRNRQQAERTPTKIVVLTVDHGLRPEAAAEAEFVREAADGVGFEHATLEWKGAKPKTGVQDAARSARYTLMAEFAQANGLEAIVTAHQLDDQAETLLMRLARGSGVDGLAAMSARSHWTPPGASGGVVILRPLLSAPRSRLEASLTAAGVAWIEDPSNANERYERTLVRRSLTAPGAALRAKAVALAARRLGRAREALDAVAAEFIRGTVHCHPSGFGQCDLDELRRAPAEIGLRALAHMSGAFGDRSAPPRMERLEAAFERLLDEAPQGFTLGGCAFTVSGARLRAFREAGRMGNPTVVLPPGEKALWDQRFAVAAAPTAPAALTVRALGRSGVSAAGGLATGSEAVPYLAATTSPGFWLGADLVAAPALGAFADAEGLFWTRSCVASFVPPPSAPPFKAAGSP